VVYRSHDERLPNTAQSWTSCQATFVSSI